MTTQENELISSISAEYISALKNYSSSQLAMFKDQAEFTASRLFALGVSEDCLDELWEKHCGIPFSPVVDESDPNDGFHFVSFNSQSLDIAS